LDGENQEAEVAGIDLAEFTNTFDEIVVVAGTQETFAVTEPS
jgi:hypothetical protein